MREGAAVDLYWIPLGAGASVVRLSGKVYEAASALVQRRTARPLFHSALEVTVPGRRVIIEMTPVFDEHGERRGSVSEGSVGTSLLGRFRVFRYEIHRWDDGVIPDLAEAIGGANTVSDDPEVAQRILDLVPSVPTPVWGRDELVAGEMWNSNSVTSWLLAVAGVDAAPLAPPMNGRAPGWSAGVVVAERACREMQSGADASLS